MTVQELLQKCRDEKKLIITLEDKRDTLRTKLLPRTLLPPKIDVQTSIRRNTLEDVTIAAAELNAEIQSRYERGHSKGKVETYRMP